MTKEEWMQRHGYTPNSDGTYEPHAELEYDYAINGPKSKTIEQEKANKERAKIEEKNKKAAMPSPYKQAAEAGRAGAMQASGFVKDASGRWVKPKPDPADVDTQDPATRTIANSVKSVANAKPGDQIIRSNGKVITLKWVDINYARKQLGLPVIDPASVQTEQSPVQTQQAVAQTSVQQKAQVKKPVQPAQTQTNPATTPTAQQPKKTYSRNTAIDLGIIKPEEPGKWTANVNTSPKSNAKLNRLLGIPANYQGMLSFDASGIRTDRMTKPIPYSTKNAQLIRSILGSSDPQNTVSDVSLKNVAKALTKYRW